MNSPALPLLAIGVGALAGAGLFVLIAAIVGILTLLITRWVVAGIDMALLAYSWRSLSGAASERKAMARLEGLATWTESLRDTIAGAVGLEQAIPASTRVADASIREPLTRLRGPGLRDLLGALADSVREELDMRRKINPSRRSTRRSVQIVIAVSVLMAIFLAVLDHRFLEPYDSVFGQLVLAVIVGIYALGIIWLRKLARFDLHDPAVPGDLDVSACFDNAKAVNTSLSTGAVLPGQSPSNDNYYRFTDQLTQSPTGQWQVVSNYPIVYYPRAKECKP